MLETCPTNVGGTSPPLVDGHQTQSSLPLLQSPCSCRGLNHDSCIGAGRYRSPIAAGAAAGWGRRRRNFWSSYLGCLAGLTAVTSTAAAARLDVAEQEIEPRRSFLRRLSGTPAPGAGGESLTSSSSPDDGRHLQHDRDRDAGEAAGEDEPSSSLLRQGRTPSEHLDSQPWSSASPASWPPLRRDVASATGSFLKTMAETRTTRTSSRGRHATRTQHQQPPARRAEMFDGLGECEKMGERRVGEQKYVLLQDCDCTPNNLEATVPTPFGNVGIDQYRTQWGKGDDFGLRFYTHDLVPHAAEWKEHQRALRARAARRAAREEKLRKVKAAEVLEKRRTEQAAEARTGLPHFSPKEDTWRLDHNKLDPGYVRAVRRKTEDEILKKITTTTSTSTSTSVQNSATEAEQHEQEAGAAAVSEVDDNKQEHPSGGGVMLELDHNNHPELPEDELDKVDDEKMQRYAHLMHRGYIRGLDGDVLGSTSTSTSTTTASDRRLVFARNAWELVTKAAPTFAAVERTCGEVCERFEKFKFFESSTLRPPPDLSQRALIEGGYEFEESESDCQDCAKHLRESVLQLNVTERRFARTTGRVGGGEPEGDRGAVGEHEQEDLVPERLSAELKLQLFTLFFLIEHPLKNKQTHSSFTEQEGRAPSKDEKDHKDKVEAGKSGGDGGELSNPTPDEEKANPSSARHNAIDQVVRSSTRYNQRQRALASLSTCYRKCYRSEPVLSAGGLAQPDSKRGRKRRIRHANTETWTQVDEELARKMRETAFTKLATEVQWASGREGKDMHNPNSTVVLWERPALIAAARLAVVVEDSDSGRNAEVDRDRRHSFENATNEELRLLGFLAAKALRVPPPLFHGCSGFALHENSEEEEARVNALWAASASGEEDEQQSKRQMMQEMKRLNESKEMILPMKRYTCRLFTRDGFQKISRQTCKKASLIKPKAKSKGQQTEVDGRVFPAATALWVEAGQYADIVAGVVGTDHNKSPGKWGRAGGARAPDPFAGRYYDKLETLRTDDGDQVARASSTHHDTVRVHLVQLFQCSCWYAVVIAVIIALAAYVILWGVGAPEMIHSAPSASSSSSAQAAQSSRVGEQQGEPNDHDHQSSRYNDADLLERIAQSDRLRGGTQRSASHDQEVVGESEQRRTGALAGRGGEKEVHEQQRAGAPADVWGLTSPPRSRGTQAVAGGSTGAQEVADPDPLLPLLPGDRGENVDSRVHVQRRERGSRSTVEDGDEEDSNHMH